MATWQQGNSGGLLAGIGGINANAPQANDINATLGLIRDNNDFARSGSNNVALTGLRGLVGVAEQYQQGQQQQRQGEFQKAYGAAFQSGDRGAMRDLAAQYPEQFESVQKGMGFIDDDHRNTIGTLATSGQLAATQGPEGFASWLKGNASELQRVGINPADVATMYQQSPEGFQQLAGNMAMFSLGPEKAFEVQDKMAGRGVSQQNANTSAFSAQQNARQGDERLAIDRYKAQTGNDLAAEELRLKAALGGAKNDIAREALQQKLSVVGQARNEKINSTAGNVADIGRALAVGNELGGIINSHPTAVTRAQNYNPLTGGLGFLPDVAEDTRKLSSKVDEYNLKVVLPALRGTFGGNPTEGERKALIQSSNNLKKVTNNADFIKELDRTQNTLTQMQKRQIKGLGIPVTKSQDESTDTKMLISDPSLVEEYIRAHGYLPEEYYRNQLNGAK